MRNCLIVGAGMAGLNAARVLKKAGWQVTVLDKGRGVGGRLATRRIDDGVYDHGAQFITARDPRFQELMSRLEQEGVVYEWCRGIGTPAQPAQSDGHPRYQGTGGMAAIAKHLARGIDVRTRQRVVKLKQSSNSWTAGLESGQIIDADALIVTTPIPQALDLLDLGGTELPDESREQLDRMKYHPCIALMVSLDQPSLIPEPGALRFEEGPLSFICDNRIKGISPDATAVTVHASATFSREHWGVSESTAIEFLLRQAQPWLSGPPRVAVLHRWRFSMPVEAYPAPFLHVQGRAPLLFAGDIFNGPRVEGAALSGMAAAEELLASSS